MCATCMHHHYVSATGERFHFPEEGVWTVPDKGILEFDFVDFVRVAKSIS